MSNHECMSVELMFLLDVLFVKSRNAERKDSAIQLKMDATRAE